MVSNVSHLKEEKVLPFWKQTNFVINKKEKLLLIFGKEITKELLLMDKEINSENIPPSDALFKIKVTQHTEISKKNSQRKDKQRKLHTQTSKTSSKTKEIDKQKIWITLIIFYLVVKCFLQHFSTQTSFAKSKIFFWVVKKAKSIQNDFKTILPITVYVSKGSIGKHKLAVKGEKTLYIFFIVKINLG